MASDLIGRTVHEESGVDAGGSDLSVEPPTKLEFVINMKTAKAIDVTIPPSVRLRADQVIESLDEE